MNYRKLVKTNIELYGKLNKDYKKISADMDLYLSSKLRSYVDTEIIMYDINSMLIKGQSRNESVEEVIGNDIELFCDEVLKNYPKISLKDRIVNILFYDYFGRISFLIGILIIAFLYSYRKLEDLKYFGLGYIVVAIPIYTITFIIKLFTTIKNANIVRMTQAIFIIIYITIIYKFRNEIYDLLTKVDIKFNSMILISVILLLISTILISYFLINKRVKDRIK